MFKEKYFISQILEIQSLKVDQMVQMEVVHIVTGDIKIIMMCLEWLDQCMKISLETYLKRNSLLSTNLEI